MATQSVLEGQAAGKWPVGGGSGADQVKELDGLWSELSGMEEAGTFHNLEQGLGFLVRKVGHTLWTLRCYMLHNHYGPGRSVVLLGHENATPAPGSHPGHLVQEAAAELGILADLCRRKWRNSAQGAMLALFAMRAQAIGDALVAGKYGPAEPGEERDPEGYALMKSTHRGDLWRSNLGNPVSLRSDDEDTRRWELETWAKEVWRTFRFLDEGFLESVNDNLAPVAVKGLKNVLRGIKHDVDTMGESLDMGDSGEAEDVTAWLTGGTAFVAPLAGYAGEPTGAGRTLRETFAFLDVAFLSQDGGLEKHSAAGLRRILRTIQSQVNALADLAEAGQADQPGEAKPGRVVPFKAPADQEPQAAACGVRFARDLDHEAQPAPATRRGFLSWLNPRNWR